MTEKQFKQLLDKFLEGKASEIELEPIKKFEDYFLDKNRENEILNSTKKHVLKQEMYQEIKQKKSANKFPWRSIAASFVLLLGLGFSLLYMSENNDPGFTVVKNTTEEPKILNLNDGSEITLNRNSQISYREDFNSEAREIQLTGEAFFKVTTDTQKPFTVTTQNLTTEVVGTAFNIRENDSLIDVTVSEGIVNVYDNDEHHQLNSNQQIVYNINSGTMNKNAVNHNYSC